MADAPGKHAQDLSYCFVIPHYCHESLLAPLLQAVSAVGFPVFIVDDGSPAESRRTLVQMAEAYDGVTVLGRPVNGGKGAAVMDGIWYARAHGLTHAIQIDADGQHDLADLPEFLRVSRAAPNAIVSGQPVFGDDAPRSRKWGRQITNFWIHIETLSAYIPDAMCGYRIYPLSASAAIMATGGVGKRMDFDVEFLVRAAWAGHPVVFVPTRVQYAPGGISHFRLIRDNIGITCMHCRLFFGMLIRLPVLLRRKLFPDRYPTGPDGSLNGEYFREKGSYIEK